ncbi:hypothetical protein MPSEU_000423800 [Mayamaea pseudoterrestris]|nr:hypothetical protein MPSEU_000423800 [Mayamaea pseudoterrestris]
MVYPHRATTPRLVVETLLEIATAMLNFIIVTLEELFAYNPPWLTIADNCVMLAILLIPVGLLIVLLDGGLCMMFESALSRRRNALVAIKGDSRLNLPTEVKRPDSQRELEIAMLQEGVVDAARFNGAWWRRKWVSRTLVVYSSSYFFTALVFGDETYFFWTACLYHAWEATMLIDAWTRVKIPVAVDSLYPPRASLALFYRPLSFLNCDATIFSICTYALQVLIFDVLGKWNQSLLPADMWSDLTYTMFCFAGLVQLLLLLHQIHLNNILVDTMIERTFCMLYATLKGIYFGLMVPFRVVCGAANTATFVIKAAFRLARRNGILQGRTLMAGEYKNYKGEGTNSFSRIIDDADNKGEPTGTKKFDGNISAHGHGAPTEAPRSDNEEIQATLDTFTSVEDSSTCNNGLSRMSGIQMDEACQMQHSLPFHNTGRNQTHTSTRSIKWPLKTETFLKKTNVDSVASAVQRGFVSSDALKRNKVGTPTVGETVPSHGWKTAVAEPACLATAPTTANVEMSKKFKIVGCRGGASDVINKVAANKLYSNGIDQQWGRGVRKKGGDVKRQTPNASFLSSASLDVPRPVTLKTDRSTDSIMASTEAAFWKERTLSVSVATTDAGAIIRPKRRALTGASASYTESTANPTLAVPCRRPTNQASAAPTSPGEVTGVSPTDDINNTTAPLGDVGKVTICDVSLIQASGLVVAGSVQSICTLRQDTASATAPALTTLNQSNSVHMTDDCRIRSSVSSTAERCDKATLIPPSTTGRAVEVEPKHSASSKGWVSGKSNIIMSEAKATLTAESASPLSVSIEGTSLSLDNCALRMPTASRSSALPSLSLQASAAPTSRLCAMTNMTAVETGFDDDSDTTVAGELTSAASKAKMIGANISVSICAPEPAIRKLFRPTLMRNDHDKFASPTTTAIAQSGSTDSLQKDGDYRNQALSNSVNLSNSSVEGLFSFSRRAGSHETDLILPISHEKAEYAPSNIDASFETLTHFVDAPPSVIRGGVDYDCSQPDHDLNDSTVLRGEGAGSPRERHQVSSNTGRIVCSVANVSRGSKNLLLRGTAGGANNSDITCEEGSAHLQVIDAQTSDEDDFTYSNNDNESIDDSPAVDPLYLDRFENTITRDEIVEMRPEVITHSFTKHTSDVYTASHARESSPEVLLGTGDSIMSESKNLFGHGDETHTTASMAVGRSGIGAFDTEVEAAVASDYVANDLALKKILSLIPTMPCGNITHSGSRLPSNLREKFCPYVFNLFRKTPDELVELSEFTFLLTPTDELTLLELRALLASFREVAFKWKLDHTSYKSQLDWFQSLQGNYHKKRSAFDNHVHEHSQTEGRCSCGLGSACPLEQDAVYEAILLTE